MKHDYFNEEYNLKRIEELNLDNFIVNWLINLKTPYHQDALHIAKKFISTNKNSNFEIIAHTIANHYEARHLFEPKFRDIKQFKTLTELIDFQTLIWPEIRTNIKLTKKFLTPLKENTDKNFIVFRVKEIYEAIALTHGHSVFDGNHYNFCLGVNLYDFNLYTHVRQKNSDSKSSLISKIPCNTLYFIRDIRRSTAYTGKIPNCIYEDPKHITVIGAGSQPIMVHAYHAIHQEYKNMNELFNKNPEFESLRSVLIFIGGSDWI